MVLNGDCIRDWPTVATTPHIGISWPVGDKSNAGGDGNGLLTWGFAGLIILAGYRSCHDQDVGPSSSGLKGAESPARKAHRWLILLLSSWYMCDVVH
jgi:hypothetical protein